VQAAAIQYVQTVSGFRRPLPADAEVSGRAVDMIASVTRDLLARLEVPPAPNPTYVGLDPLKARPWWGRA
jgi:hypothetical protein